MKKIRNYMIEMIWKSHNGFTIIFEKDGEQSTYEFSSITLKFYHKMGKKQPKLPQYLIRTILEMAIRKQAVVLSDIEIKNALWVAK